MQKPLLFDKHLGEETMKKLGFFLMLGFLATCTVAMAEEAVIDVTWCETAEAVTEYSNMSTDLECYGPDCDSYGACLYNIFLQATIACGVEWVFHECAQICGMGGPNSCFAPCIASQLSPFYDFPCVNSIVGMLSHQCQGYECWCH